jgi:hypothetical protein
VPGRRRRERAAQRAQALREVAGREGGQRARARADGLQEQAEGLRRGIDGEDREGPPQRRLRGSAGLDHHELAGAGRARDLRVAHGEDHVRAVERLTRDQHGVPIDGRRGRHPFAMISRRPLNSFRMPALRAGVAAGLAALLLAADLVLLTLFLNPEVTLRGDGLGAAHVAPLPWTALALPGLWLVVLVSSALPGWPRAARPPLEALPA